MSLVALMALSILAAEPAMAPPANPDPAAARSETEDIPPGAPTDDYGFVGWCYGATDEYLTIYTKVLPDLKDIDKTFGSPVKEDVPYATDVEAQHKALKRFGDAMAAAEKATSDPISTTEGQAAIAKGRGIWSVAETLPSRKLADAWLFWGIPVRCERTAKTLHDHPLQAMAAIPPAAVQDPVDPAAAAALPSPGDVDAGPPATAADAAAAAEAGPPADAPAIQTLPDAPPPAGAAPPPANPGQ
jgi:hypothetical protein